MQRLRVTFSRGGETKHITHLDLMRLWERALRRAGVPLAYSEGFNPHARLALAAPLAVGVTSDAELLDVFLTGRVSPHAFLKRVAEHLPVGIAVSSAMDVPLPAPSLQSQLRFIEYRVEVASERPRDESEAAIRRFLALEELPWEHARDTGPRRYDLRGLVEELRLEGRAMGRCVLFMRVRAGSGGSGRPEQVTLALGFEEPPLSVHRTGLVLAAPGPAEQPRRPPRDLG